MVRKGQSAVEFFVLVIFAFFLVLGFMSVFQKTVFERADEKRNFEIQELAKIIQNEIAIAANAADGYQRRFEIPEKVAGKEFSIGVYEGYVYLNTTDGRHAMALPTYNVTGQLYIGDNLIRTINSTVFLN